MTKHEKQEDQDIMKKIFPQNVFSPTQNNGGAKGAGDGDGSQGEEFHLAIKLGLVPIHYPGALLQAETRSSEMRNCVPKEGYHVHWEKEAFRARDLRQRALAIWGSLLAGKRWRCKLGLPGCLHSWLFGQHYVESHKRAVFQSWPHLYSRIANRRRKFLQGIMRSFEIQNHVPKEVSCVW